MDSMRSYLIACAAAALIAGLPACAHAQDTLTIGSASAAAGTEVEVPITLTDAGGTSLGADQPAANAIQGLALQVSCSPAQAIQSVTIRKAGQTGSQVPAYETTRQKNGTAGYLGVFAPLTGADAQVAKLSVVIASSAENGSTISLSFVKANTLLANQLGTVSESTLNGKLRLIDGAITVSSGSSAKPAVSITAGIPVAVEKTRRAGSFVLTRSGSLAGPLTVNVSLSGTAKNGVDYKRISNTVKFKARQQTATVGVKPIADQNKERPERVTMTVKKGKNYSKGAPGSASVTIQER